MEREQFFLIVQSVMNLRKTPTIGEWKGLIWLMKKRKSFDLNLRLRRHHNLQGGGWGREGARQVLARQQQRVGRCCVV